MTKPWKCNPAKCHPSGGHSTPNELFDCVYCEHDGHACYVSPYLEWSASEKDESDTYSCWLKQKFLKPQTKGHDK